VEAKPKQIRHYVAPDGRIPFEDWMDGIETKNPKAWDIVNIRLKRVAAGLFGNAHGVGGGVSELVIDFGPGYRVYYGIDGDGVILLMGGSKATQTRDIKNAKALWEEYTNA
jgi:putative addiction module killer protein